MVTYYIYIYLYAILVCAASRKFSPGRQELTASHIYGKTASPTRNSKESEYMAYNTMHLKHLQVQERRYIGSRVFATG